MATGDFRLCDILLGTGFAGSDARIRHEQAIAIFCLIEAIHSPLLDTAAAHTPLPSHGQTPVWHLHITTAEGVDVASRCLALAALRRVIKEYSRICDGYVVAIAWPGPSRLDAIDMSRRSIHDAAAALLSEQLSSEAIVDKDTARRLLTLIYTLLPQKRALD
ncbi:MULTISPECIES: UPF0262 family protein [unclassified Mesorhizobium]|uniref:UPF0262 family protein n=1 Tax=unclassified Mesorhizobium TaxID=325217 RepID=UPI0018DB480A|nr:UPF0262 family protein [Mesorhizobium sp. LSJC268A00]